MRPNTKVQTLDPKVGKWKIWDVFPGHVTDEPDPSHIEVLRVALMNDDPSHWNDWRAANPTTKPSLARIEFAMGRNPNGSPQGVDLSHLNLSDANLNGCRLGFATINNTNLRGAQLRETLINQSSITNSDLADADLTQASMSAIRCVNTNFADADLSRALLHSSKLFACIFDGADMENALLDGALVAGCSFRQCAMTSARVTGADMSGCNLTGADLSSAHFAHTNLRSANLSGARIYGVNCWDVTITNDTVQQDLIISLPGEPTISVDDIRVAQFLHLILNNENLRTVIDTVGQKAVLILGRFGDGGVEVLKGVASALRDNGYIPMLFDFSRPADKSWTDTIRTLAGLARFVIADLSGPSVPQELYATVPHIKIPFVPIIQSDHQVYSMFADLLEYDWVLRPVIKFDSVDALITDLPKFIIEPVELRIAERRGRLEEILGA